MPRSAAANYVLYFASIVILLSTFYILAKNINQNKSVEPTYNKGELVGELNYWKRIISDFPTYRDGYMQVAILENLIGDKQNAIHSLEKAKSLDPNSKEIEALEKSFQAQN